MSKIKPIDINSKTGIVGLAAIFMMVLAGILKLKDVHDFFIPNGSV